MFVTIIIFVVILSLLVFVHELGHFWAARKIGVRAEEFGFGFPPRAIGFQLLKNKSRKKIAEAGKGNAAEDEIKRKDEALAEKELTAGTGGGTKQPGFFRKWKLIRGGEPKYLPDEQGAEKSTIYSLNWVPLGGFVRIKGEDGSAKDQPDSFAAKKIWQRAVILLAGVSMNIVLAMFLISAGFMIGLPQVLDERMPAAKITSRQIQVIEVIPDTPAAESGVKTGDIILSINGESFSASDELRNFVAGAAGRELEYKFRRGQTEITKTITPRLMAETGQGGIGVAIAETGLVRYSFFQAIWQGIKTTVFLTWAIILAFYGLIKNLLLGQSVSEVLAGPVGIAVLTGQVARLGLIYVLQFAAILSINLAIINAFPFPALDGGRLLFLLIEKIKGSPVKKEVEGVIHNVGFALLMVLVVFVTFKDVTRYADLFKNLWSRIAE